MPSIKVQSTAKGKSHWESFLLEKQEIRLLKLLTQLEVKAATQNKVMVLFKKSVNFSNIVNLSNHDIKTFLHGMLNGELQQLAKSGTTTLITKPKNQEN